MRGNTYLRGNRPQHNTGTVHLFSLVLSQFLSLFTFFASSVSGFFCCRLSTVIPVIQQLPGDSDQGKLCHFLFWLCNGRNETFIFVGKKSSFCTRFTGNHSIHWWCHTSTAMTLNNQYLRMISWSYVASLNHRISNTCYKCVIKMYIHLYILEWQKWQSVDMYCQQYMVGFQHVHSKSLFHLKYSLLFKWMVWRLHNQYQYTLSHQGNPSSSNWKHDSE